MLFSFSLFLIIILSRSHFLSMLLTFELGVLIIILGFFYFNQYSAWAMTIALLVLAGIEAAVGLSILVSKSRKTNFMGMLTNMV